jgi:hypothetical protein
MNRIRHYLSRNYKHNNYFKRLFLRNGIGVLKGINNEEGA